MALGTERGRLTPGRTLPSTKGGEGCRWNGWEWAGSRSGLASPGEMSPSSGWAGWSLGRGLEWRAPLEPQLALSCGPLAASWPYCPHLCLLAQDSLALGPACPRPHTTILLVLPPGVGALCVSCTGTAVWAEVAAGSCADLAAASIGDWPRAGVLGTALAAGPVSTKHWTAVVQSLRVRQYGRLPGGESPMMLWNG